LPTFCDRVIYSPPALKVRSLQWPPSRIITALLILLASLSATALRAQTTATPVITLATVTYTMPTSTTITDSTSGASILWCYIASGTCTPATSYTAAVYLDPTTSETICANATVSGYSVSPNVCHTYTNSGSQVTAAPVITLATGTYAMPTSTTITDSASGASILWCYVASGTCTPATSYTAAIYLDPTASEVICATATASGYSVSSTVCNTYTNGGSQTTTAPVITLATGTYAMPTSTTITDSTSGASILWCSATSATCTPATSYNGSITVSSAETICANATASGYSASSTVCSTYTNSGTQTTAAPVITLATGSYAMPTSTTITDTTSGASILWCYVASGTCTPATSYTAAIYLDPTTSETICATATASGYSVSSTVCNTYSNSGSTPQISGLSFSSGPPWMGLTITGTNFGSEQGNSTVSVNNTQATSIISWSSTMIVVQVPTPTATLPTTGNVVVTVGGVPSPTGQLSAFTIAPAFGCN